MRKVSDCFEQAPHAPTRGDKGRKTPEGWRSAGVSYQQLLDADTKPVPEVLRMQSPVEPGVMRIHPARYYSPEIHTQEVEKIWKRVWQMACREEDIPEIGDAHIYNVADMSFIIVRTGAASFKALRNACLHRGRRLRDGDCKRAKEFRCYFHGWAWNIDGTLKDVTCPWDFPDVTPEQYSLPEAKVGTFSGFIFINPDQDAGPLEEFLGDLPKHFEGPSDLGRRYKRAHVAKILRCNWKIAQEAFMEGYHAAVTHPQLLGSIGDSNSQYDAWGNFSRTISPYATPSPHLRRVLSEQEILDSVVDLQAGQEPIVTVPEGMTARAFLAHGQREELRPILGEEVDTICDAYFDAIYFTLFPNFHPWPGFARIVYRFRPYGSDPDMCIMEIMMLDPFDPNQPRPQAARIHWLGVDDDFVLADELYGLARVSNQDAANMSSVQAGMKAMDIPGVEPRVQFASYQESKIRHFHQLWERWMAAE